ncbi:hypothetical protein PV326_001992, partial [Microctonus aethiopoides]
EKEILKGMIKHGGREIHMNWKKTKQLLVNEHLPVWIASTRVERSCHEVGGPYVKLRQKSLNVHDYLKPFNFPTHHNEEWNIVQHEFSANDEFQIPTKRQRLNDNRKRVM